MTSDSDIARSAMFGYCRPRKEPGKHRVAEYVSGQERRQRFNIRSGPRAKLTVIDHFHALIIKTKHQPQPVLASVRKPRSHIARAQRFKFISDFRPMFAQDTTVFRKTWRSSPPRIIFKSRYEEDIGILKRRRRKKSSLENGGVNTTETGRTVRFVVFSEFVNCLSANDNVLMTTNAVW